MARTWIYISCLVLTVYASVLTLSAVAAPPPLTTSVELPLCCLPLEFETSVFVDFGIVFIDANTAFSYINGSAKIGFSHSRQKIYIVLNGTELSPLIPKPEPYDSILLYDFGKHMMYSVTGSDCEKSSLEQNITRQCIPRDARKLSTGSVPMDPSQSLAVHTYQWTTPTDVMWQITATVYIDELDGKLPKECRPLTARYFAGSANPDSGSLYGLDIHDIRPITSKDEFEVPKQCL